MNILMVTNTYKPIVGGLEKSVENFSAYFRSRGHKCLIVAPEQEGSVKEEGVFRVPAVKGVNDTDFSVDLPLPGVLDSAVKKFNPDIVHSQHPFLMGDRAVRIASAMSIPLVFTYHSQYEKYTHYIPGNSPKMKKFVIDLAAGYCRLSEQVIAPSEYIKSTLLKRGIRTPIDVIPTGIDTQMFKSGDGRAFRDRYGIPEGSFLSGFVSRLAEEKNMDFLLDIAVRQLKRDTGSYFLMVGTGPAEGKIRDRFERTEVADRVIMPGLLSGQDLSGAYASMDAFLFVSTTETQGLVVAEAQAAGKIVVALDAPGVNEIVIDGETGFLLEAENADDFVSILFKIRDLDETGRGRYSSAAVSRGEELSIDRSAKSMLRVYSRTLERSLIESDIRFTEIDRLRDMIVAEWDIVFNIARAAGTAIVTDNKN